jgi:hypothetical protein
MKNLRQLAILLLDDENGINESAYRVLAQELIAEGHPDIVNAVTAQDGRFFLGEQDAAELRKVVPEDRYYPDETPLGEQFGGE